MTRARLNLLKAISAAGAALSAWLAVRHVWHEATGDEAGGVCALLKLAGCAAVESSRFSEFFGIPTAAFGFHYFVWLGGLAWSAAAEDAEGRAAERTRERLALWTLLGAAACAALGYISISWIGAFCLECAAVYALALAACAAVADRGPVEYFADALGGARPARPAQIDYWALLGSVALFGYASSWEVTRWAKEHREQALKASAEAAAARAGQGLSGSDEKLLAQYFASPEVVFEIGPRALARGSADAPLEIVIFSDYECPHCRKFHEAMAPILAKYEGRIRIVKKHFPLSPDCNALVRGTKFNHKRACRLAEMAQALAATGKYWESEADLYAIGERDLNPALNEIAAKAGISYRDWVAQLAEPGIRAQVEADIAEGIRLGVMEIPKVYVNRRAAPTVKPADVADVLAEVLRRSN